MLKLFLNHICIMNQNVKLLSMTITAFLVVGCQAEKTKINYPMTKKVDTVDVYFGQKVADPYRWLEDDNSAETAEWVKQQNQVTFDYLESIPFRESVKKRLADLYYYPKSSAPVHNGGRYFFYKQEGKQNQSVLYYKNKLEDEDIELLNPNTMSDEGTVALSTVSVSEDGKYIGYGIARAGSDWNELYVKDIEKNEVLPDHIKWVKFSGISWYGDGFFYSRYPEPVGNEALTGANINCRIYYHRLGTEQSADKLIYEDKQNPERSLYADVTENGGVLCVSVAESTSGNALLVKRLDSDTEFKNVVSGFENDFMPIDYINGKLLVLTNHNAPKYRLIAVDLESYSEDKWVDIIPESENVLSSVSLKSGKLIANYIKDAQSSVVVYSQEGKLLHNVDLPQIGTVSGFGGSCNDSVTFYSLVSLTSPATIYKYNVNTNKSELFRQSQIKFDGSDYETQQVFYPSKDGTKIPMFIVHKKGIKLDGTNKVWMYGYGGFNITVPPSFSVARALWIEQGGVYCVMNLRGGGEYGEEWHKAGTKFNKQNVFDDCIAAAEYMIEKGYTTAGNIVLQGGSNGGLLVGAVVNQRPDLYGVSLPNVGVMDMLRYHKFTIGKHWATDYGTSEDSKAMFEYLIKYSPLHSIKDIEYPATLVTTGDHDDRVVPAHSFKFAATLQEHQKGSAPILIRIETNAGHGVGKPASKWIEENADMISFAFYNLKMTPKY